jgi:hypothetical protein
MSLRSNEKSRCGTSEMLKRRRDEIETDTAEDVEKNRYPFTSL